MSLITEAALTLTEVFEASINLILKQDPATLEKFSSLQGKVIAFEITDLEITLFLIPHAAGIQAHYLYQGQADTTLQGSTPAFINMSTGDSTESFFNGDIRIKGDIELGQRFKRIFDQLDFDWEEILSSYTGDLIAFKAGNLIRDFSKWSKDTLKTLKLDAREYIQDEGLLSPQPGELDIFTKNISQLRDDSARLEARIGRLQKLSKETI